MTADLVVTGLRRRFPGAAAPTLDGVDLAVPAGGCVALLGPSGSGKSTVVRLVAGLDRADGGTVRIAGRAVDALPPERRGAVLVFQQPRLFPHLDVLDNVAFPREVAGLRRREARTDAGRYLELVGMGGFARRRPRSLSGGQEQRVALARALAADPQVLLLDEPFSALDPGVRAQMHRLLEELRAAVEPTILLVTHDRHEAAVVADSVAVLLDGRIAQHEPMPHLYARPSSLAVHDFLGGLNAVPGRVADGRHHSALGALPLPDRAGHREGPGTLVLRQEAVRLGDPDRSTADLVGRVVAVQARGPRTWVQVDVAGVVLHAEAGPGATSPAGAVVGLSVPVEHRHVVPPAPGPG